MVQAAVQSQIFEELHASRLGLSAHQAADHLRQHDIFQRRKLRQQVMELVNETDLVAADAGTFVVSQNRSRAAVNVDIALVGVLEQACYMQEGRLAGTRR